MNARTLLSVWLAVAGPPAVAASAPDFNRDVRPILFNNCVACHGPDEHERKAGLRLDTFAGATAELKKGGRAIVPGDRAASRMWARVTSTDPDQKMPPPESGHTLEPAQVQELGRWIDSGAEYAGHWAFQKPVRPVVPVVPDAAPAPDNPIDAFVGAALGKMGLAVQEPADWPILARRLAFDLTGLPPPPEDVETLVREIREDPAGEGPVARYVDRLLASPAFGERWARLWLDLARYADSRGYGSDPLRLNVWRYRDWVIDAFNRNLPYDQFTIEQLAGDLLPESTPDQLLATAFHRNTLTNTLGGTIDEEFRVVAVKDRAETTAQVWMGLTLKCAQCHTHKFDPITNDEYYGFYAIFNQSEDRDLPDEAPVVPMPTDAEKRRIDAITSEIAALKSSLDHPSGDFLARQTAWERSMREADNGWEAVEWASARRRGGDELERLPDGSLRATVGAEGAEWYTLESSAPMIAATGLRLELLPDPQLPAQGPGTAADGNVVVSEIKVFARPVETKSPQVRFVRIELPGDGRLLHLAEVEVISGGRNVAAKAATTQSSIDYEGVPERAVDGITAGAFEKNSVTHTRLEKDPWWEVDLAAEFPLDRIVVWNRTDNDLQKRLEGYLIRLLDAERREVGSRKPDGVPRPSQTIAVDGRREISIGAASATHEQDKFGAGRAVDGDFGEASGWAIDPRVGQAHSLVLEFAQPFVSDDSPCTLSVEIAQNRAGHAIGRFRVSVTGRPGPLRALPDSLAPVLAVAPANRSPADAARLREFYAALDPAAVEIRRKIAGLEGKIAAIKPVETPVMRELPADRRRVTRTMIKGNYLTTGDEIDAMVPAAFHPVTDIMRRDSGGRLDRLALARWLASRENPLTARVAVNRLWSQLFGRGLVLTEEDFGTQGAYPTHPELLDWLALEFMDNGWDIKRMLRTIVRSRTYRQSATVRPEHIEKDPQNAMLSRGPRFRLEAEMIRDQALSISGLLDSRLGGPSVYPPQPDGLWRAAFNGERTYPVSTGPDRYRRGIYVFIRRTVPYPSLMTFDAPNRELCTLRRIRTNTPLQAFVTLNDSAFVEMARALARRMTREGGLSPAERIAFAYRLCTLKAIAPDKLETLVELYESELAGYRAKPTEAKTLADDPLHPMPAGTDWPTMAALTVVANVLFNLDAVLMKG